MSAIRVSSLSKSKPGGPKPRVPLVALFTLVALLSVAGLALMLTALLKPPSSEVLVEEDLQKLPPAFSPTPLTTPPFTELRKVGGRPEGAFAPRPFPFQP